ncbi:hypothetical protein [Bacillus subtilis]|uniref:hypothetical protein n=1 Tax=Bacillus subtilis TaxID=1423 RepID=UPI0023ECDFEF|nr:hypothetical protein [Bacillus subtilis]MDF4200404.1 hypothetical protein [Bacillus subtilis]MDF4218737.1 hypothetical protein [Bacillus subtilis]
MPEYDIDITLACETEATECGSGARKACDSKETVIEAPEGHVIDDRTFDVEMLVERGSENTAPYAFDNYISILEHAPELKYPTTVRMHVHARSSEGRCAGGGKTEARFFGNYINYERYTDMFKDCVIPTENS